jgi:hypothetical protein
MKFGHTQHNRLELEVLSGRVWKAREGPEGDPEDGSMEDHVNINTVSSTLTPRPFSVRALRRRKIL